MAEPTYGAPLPSDVRAMKSRARSRDDTIGDAYNAGAADAAAGTPGAHRPTDPELADYYDAGLDDTTSAPGGARRGGGRRGGGGSRGPGRSGGGRGGGSGPGRGPGFGSGGPSLLSRGGAKASSAGQSGAGIILGMVAYAVIINYLRGGAPAVRGWFAAKFTNKPYGGNLTKAGPPLGVAPVGKAS